MSSVWENDPKTCTHEGTDRNFEYKEGDRITYCGGCGQTITTEPNPNAQLPVGLTKRDDLDEYFKRYADAAKQHEPRIAILSYSGWMQAGRPTFEQTQAQWQKTTKTPEGDTTVTTEATAQTGTATTTKAKKARPAGAKALVRKIFTDNPGAELTIEELATQTGKPASSITTAISDLRSAKYSKPGDPLKLFRHKSGKYSLTEPAAEEVAPATGQTAATAPAVAAQPPAAGSTDEALPQ